MKKVGLVTWLGGGNFGSCLQSYALYKKIISLGYECYFIPTFDYRNLGLKASFKYFLISIGVKKIYTVLFKKKKIVPKNLQKTQDVQKKVYKIFHVETKSHYKKLLSLIDIFCVGSDQVWNAYHSYSPFMFLDFANSKKRISYASSMGTNDFPEEYKKDIKKYLSRFSYISLRESDGCEAVKNLTGRSDVKNVLDPTFLLTKEDWIQFSSDAVLEFELPERYILCYLIGKNECYIQQIENIRNHSGIEDIIIIPADENKDFICPNAKIYKFAGMKEFVALISKASLVITDSFHATALSINLNTCFVEFLRFSNSDIKSQNSRIYNLLDIFGLKHRLFDSSDYATLAINYSQVNLILEKYRSLSLKYLEDALSK